MGSFCAVLTRPTSTGANIVTSTGRYLCAFHCWLHGFQLLAVLYVQTLLGCANVLSDLETCFEPQIRYGVTLVCFSYKAERCMRVHVRRGKCSSLVTCCGFFVLLKCQFPWCPPWINGCIVITRSSGESPFACFHFVATSAGIRWLLPGNYVSVFCVL
jgi:hypothetical protein